MTGKKGTYFKALALLIVFSLNTVVSFACSFSSLFHSFHHSSPSRVSGQSHSGGHEHGGGTGHHRESHTAHQHDDSAPSENSGDDCCSRFVVEVEKAEKAVSRTIEAPDAVFQTVFLSLFHTLFFSRLSLAEKSHYPDLVRRRLPATIQDLRIVIQSFQI